LQKKTSTPAACWSFGTRRTSEGLEKSFLGLAAEHPDIFNAYQSTQDVKVEAAMLKAKHVAFNDWHRFILH
jgi:hypothetical protein